MDIFAQKERRTVRLKQKKTVQDIKKTCLYFAFFTWSAIFEYEQPYFPGIILTTADSNVI